MIRNEQDKEKSLVIAALVSFFYTIVILALTQVYK